jgi:hypothetical protein
MGDEAAPAWSPDGSRIRVRVRWPLRAIGALAGSLLGVRRQEHLLEQREALFGAEALRAPQVLGLPRIVRRGVARMLG